MNISDLPDPSLFSQGVDQVCELFTNIAEGLFMALLSFGTLFESFPDLFK